jgi:glycerol uptake facilitator-like aquaporin
MDQKVRMYLAELFGTFVVVLAAAGTLCSTYLANDGRYTTVGGVVLSVALAVGFALAVVVTAIYPLSPGCCNPAITLTLWICNRLEAARAGGLIAAQALGSLLAALTLRGLFNPDVLAEARLGMPHLRQSLLGPEGEITLGALATGVLLEFGFAFFLCVAAFATLMDKRAPRLGGLPLGLAQVVIVLFGFHLTGGAANPALYFGPAVGQLTVNVAVLRPFADHPVYWAGPFLGAAAGGLFYTLLLLPENQKATR